MPSRCYRCGHQGVEVAIAKFSDDPLFWICTWCDNRWHIHPDGTALHEVADIFVDPDKRSHRRDHG